MSDPVPFSAIDFDSSSDEDYTPTTYLPQRAPTSTSSSGSHDDDNEPMDLEDYLEEREALNELEGWFGAGGEFASDEEDAMDDGEEEEEGEGEGVVPLGGFDGNMTSLVQALQTGTAPPAIQAHLDSLLAQIAPLGGPAQITILRNPHTGELSLSLGASQSDDYDEEDDDDDYYDDDDDEEDVGGTYSDDALPGTGGRLPRRTTTIGGYQTQLEPDERGMKLRFGGEFGPVGRKEGGVQRVEELVWGREMGGSRRPRPWMDVAKSLIPNTPGTVVANLTAPPYCGQYSSDSSFFYTATKDFNLTLFSTSSALTQRPPTYLTDSKGGRSSIRRGSLWDEYGEGGMERGSGKVGESSVPVVKKLEGGGQGWTVTDADLAVGDEWMIYSSLDRTVRLFNTRDQDSSTIALDFSAPFPGARYRTAEYMRVWSVRFSADGKEIVGGASAESRRSDNDGKIVVYDLEKNAPTLMIDAHEDDVNSVCWADKQSKHILCSASDDGYVKIWDRRSLSSGKPSGILVGHTEGITTVDAKGDGRYVLSNGKDQTARLFDLRSMSPASVTESNPSAARRWGTGFDYRMDNYRRPRYQAAPGDNSIMTYRGHSVSRTLIRAHFAPENSTGQDYVYSGSADGRVHIWNLDGTVVQVLDRKLTVPLVDSEKEGVYSDPSGAERATSGGASRASRANAYCVRDVAWHAYKSEMMSSAWDPSGRGSIAKHEWKGFGKNGLTIEDVLERERAQVESF